MSEQSALQRKLEREIAARKQAEQLLEEKSRELFQRNAALLREVERREEIERALAAKAADLARSNSELQQFAYVASHDLQAPLRNVVSFSRILSERYSDALDREGLEFLAFVREGALSMHMLINDLLDLSRVETRGGEFLPCDLNTVLQDALQVLAPEVERIGAEVVVEPMPQIIADATQLNKLFENLLANAMKFQQTGTRPRVSVSAQIKADDCHIKVCDNGIGIDARHLEQIFVIFRRLHAPDEYPGTGIGLAICKKIVDRHGGRVWAESSLGEGTVFNVLLPARQPEYRTPAPKT